MNSSGGGGLQEGSRHHQVSSSSSSSCLVDALEKMMSVGEPAMFVRDNFLLTALPDLINDDSSSSSGASCGTACSCSKNRLCFFSSLWNNVVAASSACVGLSTRTREVAGHVIMAIEKKKRRNGKEPPPGHYTSSTSGGGHHAKNDALLLRTCITSATDVYSLIPVAAEVAGKLIGGIEGRRIEKILLKSLTLLFSLCDSVNAFSITVETPLVDDDDAIIGGDADGIRRGKRSHKSAASVCSFDVLHPIGINPMDWRRHPALVVVAHAPTTLLAEYCGLDVAQWITRRCSTATTGSTSTTTSSSSSCCRGSHSSTTATAEWVSFIKIVQGVVPTTTRDVENVIRALATIVISSEVQLVDDAVIRPASIFDREGLRLLAALLGRNEKRGGEHRGYDEEEEDEDGKELDFIASLKTTRVAATDACCPSATAGRGCGPHRYIRKIVGISEDVHRFLCDWVNGVSHQLLGSTFGASGRNQPQTGSPMRSRRGAGVVVGSGGGSPASCYRHQILCTSSQSIQNQQQQVDASSSSRHHHTQNGGVHTLPENLTPHFFSRTSAKPGSGITTTAPPHPSPPSPLLGGRDLFTGIILDWVLHASAREFKMVNIEQDVRDRLSFFLLSPSSDSSGGDCASGDRCSAAASASNNPSYCCSPSAAVELLTECARDANRYTSRHLTITSTSTAAVSTTKGGVPTSSRKGGFSSKKRTHHHRRDLVSSSSNAFVSLLAMDHHHTREENESEEEDYRDDGGCWDPEDVAGGGAQGSYGKSTTTCSAAKVFHCFGPIIYSLRDSALIPVPPVASSSFFPSSSSPLRMKWREGGEDDERFDTTSLVGCFAKQAMRQHQQQLWDPTTTTASASLPSGKSNAPRRAAGRRPTSFDAKVVASSYGSGGIASLMNSKEEWKTRKENVRKHLGHYNDKLRAVLNVGAGEDVLLETSEGKRRKIASPSSSSFSSSSNSLGWVFVHIVPAIGDTRKLLKHQVLPRGSTCCTATSPIDDGTPVVALLDKQRAVDSMRFSLCHRLVEVDLRPRIVSSISCGEFCATYFPPLKEMNPAAVSWLEQEVEEERGATGRGRNRENGSGGAEVSLSDGAFVKLLCTALELPPASYYLSKGEAQIDLTGAAFRHLTQYSEAWEKLQVRNQRRDMKPVEKHEEREEATPMERHRQGERRNNSAENTAAKKKEELKVIMNGKVKKIERQCEVGTRRPSYECGAKPSIATGDEAILTDQEGPGEEEEGSSSIIPPWRQRPGNSLEDLVRLNKASRRRLELEKKKVSSATIEGTATSHQQSSSGRSVTPIAAMKQAPLRQQKSTNMHVDASSSGEAFDHSSWQNMLNNHYTSLLATTTTAAVTTTPRGRR